MKLDQLKLWLQRNLLGAIGMVTLKCVKCGTDFEVYPHRVREGQKFCSKKCLGSPNRKHGLTETRIYMIWAGMKSRCDTPSNVAFVRYGLRGIKVCKEWSESFEAFAEWSQSNGYRDDLQIDRIDGNLGYCPENCRWATIIEQARNKGKRTEATASSKFKGVSWHNGARKWQARIYIDGKRIYLGLFASESDAAREYDRAAKQYYGEFAYLNFKEEPEGK